MQSYIQLIIFKKRLTKHLMTHMTFSLELMLISPCRREKNTMFQVSSFVRSQFNRKYKNVSYDDNEVYSSDDEYDYKYEIDSSANREEEDTSEDEENVFSVSASRKSQFHGMRVFDNIPPSLSKSYFAVKIDGKKKFIHKQTACRLFTDEKSLLSADRIKRVQQAT